LASLTRSDEVEGQRKRCARVSPSMSHTVAGSGRWLASQRAIVTSLRPVGREEVLALLLHAPGNHGARDSVPISVSVPYDLQRLVTGLTRRRHR
jgi:hypothetical protein